VKRVVKNCFEEIGCFIIPVLYGLFIRFVWLTSTRNDHQAIIQEHQRNFTGIVALLWHQEVVTTPYVFRGLQIRTLASTNTLGRLITAILESNQFQVFRGGRRHKIILKDMIRYLDKNPQAKYGITVDGSRGPARVMKRGACMIARETGTPLFVTSTRLRHGLYTPTWDRTMIPLPFNRIETQIIGPYWIDPQCTDETFDAFCDHIQNELLSLTDYCDRRVKKGRIDPLVRQDFPENWDASRWPENTIGLALSEWDLQADTFPPWSRTAQSI
jgi:lysophospholipid acyltransferase (LPLAT)-like uncharacterized protein